MNEGRGEHTLLIDPDLYILLSQLSDVAQAVRNPAVAEFSIEFYEQGFLRWYVFKLQQGIYSDFSLQNMSNLLFDTSSLQLQQTLAQVVQTFVSAITVIDPSVTVLSVFRDWLSLLALPGLKG